VVSELALCEDQRTAARLWRSVRTALLKTSVGRARIERVVSERDLKELAALVNSLF